MNATFMNMKTVLLVSGSTRTNSTNSAALRTIASMEIDGVQTVFDEHLVTSLPHFDPDLDTDAPPAAVARLRKQVNNVDVVVFSTPEYAGSMPGSLKNLLEWTVGSTVLNGKPVAWLNVAAPNRGTGAIAQLEEVLGYVNADLRKNACVTHPFDHSDFHTLMRQALRSLCDISEAL
jgi:NAD(P)H-dependent FMN reductase